MIRRRTLTSLLLVGTMSTILTMVAVLPANATTFVRIKNFGNELCLQPAGDATGTGVAIVQEPCTTDPAQVWEAVSVDSNNDVYHFVNETSNLCLDARGGAVNGTPVQQWTCNSITNERWTAAPGTSSANAFNSDVSGSDSMCLDVPGQSMQQGLGEQIYGCNGTVAQAWYTN